MLRLDYEHILPFVDPADLDRRLSHAREAHRLLIEKSGPGGDATGWRDLLIQPDEALLQDIAETARRIREEADVLVCIGIGGSYLGAEAVIQALSPSLGRNEGSPDILFAGHHMGGAYLQELLEYLHGKSVFVNVISKSGRTLEPAIAFRCIRQYLEKHFDDADQRIIVTTDPEKGALNTLRATHGYKKYVIPGDVGGRFSVLTPVGLLPIAVAGIDILALFEGAAVALARLASPKNNSALLYAAIRSVLLEQGLCIDLLSVFEPALSGFGRWWQQLFGESEGKSGTGLFPFVAQYSTDLHSIGQYVQEGQRSLMETFLMVEQTNNALAVPAEPGGGPKDLDGLDYLAGRSMETINRAAWEGTAQAHTDGGVPNLTLWMREISPTCLGEAISFFEHAVAVSGYLLGVNPFDQPGVEAYKKEMFTRLGKP